jgi:rhodanese-related sulfurtransferase
MKFLEPAEFLSLSSQGHVIVDTRKPEVFVDGFYSGSISIPFDDDFVANFQELVDSDQAVVLVAEEADAAAIFKKVKAAGLLNVQGILKGEFNEASIDNKLRDMIITIDAEELNIDYRFDEFFLVDVRTAEEFKEEHLEYAENIELADLESLVIDLEAAGSYYVYAGNIRDAVTAGSIFKLAGFDLIKVVADTYENIKATGIPLIVQNKKQSPSTKFSRN